MPTPRPTAVCLAASLAALASAGASRPARAQDEDGTPAPEAPLEERVRELERTVRRQRERIEEQARALADLEGRLEETDAPAPRGPVERARDRLHAAPLSEERPAGSDPGPIREPARGNDADRSRTDAAPGASSAEEPGSALRAGYDPDPARGFFVGTEDGRFELRPAVLLQVDARFATAGHPGDDDFLVRRARLGFAGRLFEDLTFKIDAELGEGDARLNDGWLRYELGEGLALRGGQFKVPFGLELLISAADVPFIERSLATDAITPGRDVGAQLEAQLGGERLRMQLGVFRGSGQNRSDDDDAKDLVGRLVLRPFGDAKADARPLGALHLGGAATWGRQDDAIGGRSLLTAIDTPYFTYADGVVQDGDRLRLGAELAWLFGPASLRAEYMSVRLADIEGAGASRDARLHGWYVAATVLLTGEDATLDRVVPRESVADGGPGALELAVRVGEMHTDESLVELGLARGTGRATELTVGLNWYLHTHLAVRADYVGVWFDDAVTVDGESIDGEDALLVRVQLAF